MLAPYVNASRMAFERSALRFRKKLTVIGIIGHTHGVARATSPPKKPSRKIVRRERSAPPCPSSSPKELSLSITGVHKSDTAVVSTFITTAEEAGATDESAIAFFSSA